MERLDMPWEVSGKSYTRVSRPAIETGDGLVAADSKGAQYMYKHF